MLHYRSCKIRAKGNVRYHPTCYTHPMIITLPDNLIGGKISTEDAEKFLEEMEYAMILKGVKFPKAPSSDGYYHVQLKTPTGRRQIKDKSLERLKEKYVAKYKEAYEVSETFEVMFEKMRDQKISRVKDPEKLHSLKNTIYRYNSDYKKFFKDSKLSKISIDKITPHDIEDFCEDVLTKHNLHAQGFKNIRTILNKTFLYAYQNGKADNTAKKVDYKQFDSMLIPSAKISERLHTDEEIDRMLKYLRDSKYNRSCIGRFALELQLLMGSREGEIPPLEWGDISDGCINITKEQLNVRDGGKQYNVIVNHTKTSTDRKFPVTNEIEEFLERLRKYHSIKGIDSKYLFPTKNGVVANHTIYRTYMNMCNKLGIEIVKEKRKGPHSFRRNHITKTINNSNGNIMMAAKLYGNSVETIQRNYYDSLDMDEAKNVVEMMF